MMAVIPLCFGLCYEGSDEGRGEPSGEALAGPRGERRRVIRVCVRENDAKRLFTGTDRDIGDDCYKKCCDLMGRNLPPSFIIILEKGRRKTGRTR